MRHRFPALLASWLPQPASQSFVPLPQLANHPNWGHACPCTHLYLLACVQRRSYTGLIPWRSHGAAPANAGLAKNYCRGRSCKFQCGRSTHPSRGLPSQLERRRSTHLFITLLCYGQGFGCSACTWSTACETPASRGGPVIACSCCSSCALLEAPNTTPATQRRCSSHLRLREVNVSPAPSAMSW